MSFSCALKSMFMSLILLLGVSISLYAENQKIIYIQDGAIDELVVPMLLKTMGGVDHLATIIVNGDCYADTALQAQGKIDEFIGSEVPLGISSAVAVNPFPDAFRHDADYVNSLPILNTYGHRLASSFAQSGDDVLAQVFKNAADNSLTILLNCGATPLTNLFKLHPEYINKVKKLIWMGGAINVMGNVVLHGTLTTAEWNMYWDPVSAEWLLENTNFPIILFPLDITDQVKLYWDLAKGQPYIPGINFLNALCLNSYNYNYSELALDMYDIILNNSETFYSLWDTTSACYLTHPEFFLTQDMKLKVSQGEHGIEGTLYKDPAGRDISVAMYIKNNDPTYIFNYIIQQFKCSSIL